MTSLRPFARSRIATIGRPRSPIALTLLIGLLAAACAPSPTLPTPVATLPTSASPTPTSGAWAPVIRVALPGDTGPFGPLSNANSPVGDDYQKAGNVVPMLYAGLFRADATLRPRPDLASSCDVDSDQLTITCHLVSARFHDGMPVTADDVVFTYEVQNADTTTASPFGRSCVDNLNVGTSGCLSDVLASVSKVDQRTVAFHLKQPYGPFLTDVLPFVWIDSQAVVTRDFDAFRAKASTFPPAKLVAAASVLAKPATQAGANCEPLLMDGVQMAARAGLLVPDRAEYDYLPGGAFDACGFAAQLSLELTQAAASLGAAGARAIALVYPDLAFNRQPIGAGPYRLASYVPGKKVVLQADPGYHNGPPITQTFEFDVYSNGAAAAEAVRTGAADVFTSFDQAAVRGLDRAQGVQVAAEADPAFVGLFYNVRPGHLFADPALRMALDLCLDKPALVVAATDGGYAPTYADVPLGTWATDPNLPKPARDVARAKALIAAAGWRIGPDGIFIKGGRRLAATVYVRNDAPERVKLVELVGIEAKDCGMDLRPSLGDFGGNLQAVYSWPNIPPGAKSAFDILCGAEIFSYDPMPLIFTTGQITTRALPFGQNFGGFSDPRIDQLLAQLAVTYDIDTRASLYRQYQELVAQEQPAYFAWNEMRFEAVTAGLTTSHGALDLGAANAIWQFETIGLPASDVRIPPSGP